jgi:hypothetical protein
MSGSGVGSWRAGGTAGMVRSQRRDGASDSGHLFQAYVEGTCGQPKRDASLDLGILWAHVSNSVVLNGFQRRAEAALINLVQQGLVTGVRALVFDDGRRIEVSVSVQTDENAPDFDRAKYDDARRRIGAALHGVEWMLVSTATRS